MKLGSFNDTQNKDLIINAIDELKLNPITDAIPKAVVPTIQPVYKVERKVDKVFYLSLSASTGGATIYTGNPNKTFYITSISVSTQSDATCDNTQILLLATLSGIVTNIIAGFRKLTTTAQVRDIHLDFSTPIKVDKGTNVDFSNAFTVGSCVSLVILRGYEE